MNQNYNKQKHRQLQKYSESLKKQGEKMAKESLQDYIQLLDYYGMIYSQLNWEQRNEYFKIFKSFIENKITTLEFCAQLTEKCDLTAEFGDELQFNIIHHKADEFTDLLDDLATECDVCEPNIVRPSDSLGLNLSELSKVIRENYRQIQQILKEDGVPLKNSIDFSGPVDRLNWEISDQYIELMEEFLRNPESSNFLHLKEKSESIVKLAKELESNSIFLESRHQALGFSNYIHILIHLLKRYQVDDKFNLEVFKYWVRKTLLEMKNHSS